MWFFFHIYKSLLGNKQILSVCIFPKVTRIFPYVFKMNIQRFNKRRLNTYVFDVWFLRKLDMYLRKPMTRVKAAYMICYLISLSTVHIRRSCLNCSFLIKTLSMIGVNQNNSRILDRCP